MLCEPCSFLPVYNRVQFTLWTHSVSRIAHRSSHQILKFQFIDFEKSRNTDPGLSYTLCHASTSEHKQARANSVIFWFWAFRARYHRLCEEFIQGNDALPKLDFKSSARASTGWARTSTGWARTSTSKFCNFPILGVSSQISSILWRIYKGKWHLPKIGF